MLNRFVFRQVQWQDIAIFLNDGEIRAVNHSSPQTCHRASYDEITNRRGTRAFCLPCGGVVNDYVPFYFSPITAYSYTVSQGNVTLINPNGIRLGMTIADDRVFIVCRLIDFQNSGLIYYFSDAALNTCAPLPQVKTDLNEIETHINWSVFDEDPKIAQISEIDYGGVCKYFKSAPLPSKWQTRSQQRMAEFLVHNALPLSLITCIITKTDAMQRKLEIMVRSSHCNIPVLVKPGCYF